MAVEGVRVETENQRIENTKQNNEIARHKQAMQRGLTNRTDSSSAGNVNTRDKFACRVPNASLAVTEAAYMAGPIRIETQKAAAETPVRSKPSSVTQQWLSRRVISALPENVRK